MADETGVEESSEELLGRLRNEHRDLDAEITALEDANPVDQIRIGRLKKRKLQLKDMITCLENGSLPDIIA